MEANRRLLATAGPLQQASNVRICYRSKPAIAKNKRGQRTGYTAYAAGEIKLCTSLPHPRAHVNECMQTVHWVSICRVYCSLS